MTWNWELPNWPKFKYDESKILSKERQFLLEVGRAAAFFKNISEQENHQFIIEILSLEGEKSSKIEGEILDRESLQSSIRGHFGLKPILKQRKLTRYPGFPGYFLRTISKNALMYSS